MKDIINYEEFMTCLEALYSDTDYGIHPTPSTTHASNLRPRLEKLVEDRSNITLLDVGCGRGQLMEFYELSGWRVAGTEISNRLIAADLCEFEEIYPYAISDLHHLAADSFSFVFLVNVLDHVWDPEDILKGLEEARRIAKYGVVVVIEGEDNFQTIDFPDWQWKSLFGNFHSTEVYEHDSGFIRILGLNEI